MCSDDDDEDDEPLPLLDPFLDLPSSFFAFSFFLIGVFGDGAGVDVTVVAPGSDPANKPRTSKQAKKLLA